MLHNAKKRNRRAGKIGEDVRTLITGKLGKPFSPEKIVRVDELSKNRVGEITRRVIRVIALGVELEELSVLENPETIEKLRSIIEKV